MATDTYTITFKVRVRAGTDSSAVMEGACMAKHDLRQRIEAETREYVAVIDDREISVAGEAIDRAVEAFCEARAADAAELG